MKTLASCTPREFLTQTVKIRRAVEKWLKDTDIINIRKNMPKLDEDMTADMRREAMEKQARENLGKIYDAMAETHPDETLELLALMCFIDPKDVDAHPMREYLAAFNELIEDKAVIGFFISLLRLGKMVTSDM